MRKLIFILSFCVGSLSYGQDIHFSMFDLSPINLNPGNTGNFDGKYRFIGNHRNQWKSVTVPFKTLNIAGDGRDIFGKKGFHGGIQINQDIAGDSKLRTFQIMASGAYENQIIDSSWTLFAGMHLGYTNKHIDYTLLEFNSQYNGVAFDPTLSNNEIFSTDARNYLKSNLGAVLLKQINANTSVDFGLGLFNIFTPRQSFFEDDNIELDRRLSLFGIGHLRLSQSLSVHPKASFMAQGKYKETIIGAEAEYHLLEMPGLYRSAWGGIYYRNKDAAYFTAGMTYDQWKFGLSYDINFSKLVPASNNRGGFEFAVIYIIRDKSYSLPVYRICPDYI